jgi:lysylphosphatidylglycerol synthetase-like protein (DUF2156 family)
MSGNPARDGRLSFERSPGEGSIWVLVAIVGAGVVVCVAAALTASRTHGSAHGVALVVAVGAGLFVAAIVVPLAAFVRGMFVLATICGDHPSWVRLTMWFTLAAVVGGLLGTDVYSVGLPGLLTGPALFAAAVALARSSMPHARRRSAQLIATAAAGALAVGLTVFV